MKRLIIFIGSIVLGTYLLRTYGVEGIYIASASMEPTYPVGTHLFLNRLIYHLKAPARGEVVVFESPIEKGKDLVKRVIAVGGDSVEIREKMAYLNGRLLPEPYVKHTRGNIALVGDNIGPVAVPQDTVFVLGDNRDSSGDSRDWRDSTGQWIPFVPVGSIKGRIISFAD